VYVLCTWVGSDGSFDELGIQVGHADANSVALLGFLYILAEHLQALHFLLNLVENIWKSSQYYNGYGYTYGMYDFLMNKYICMMHNVYTLRRILIPKIYFLNFMNYFSSIHDIEIVSISHHC
jgi:hypothetical protein